MSDFEGVNDDFKACNQFDFFVLSFECLKIFVFSVNRIHFKHYYHSKIRTYTPVHYYITKSSSQRFHYKKKMMNLYESNDWRQFKEEKIFCKNLAEIPSDTSLIKTAVKTTYLAFGMSGVSYLSVQLFKFN